MSTSSFDVESAAADLLAAGAGQRAARWPELDIETAYRVQDEAFCLRLERGETVSGVSLHAPSDGGTPQTGWLTDAMAVASVTGLARERLSRPCVTPELAFVMGKRLAGPGVTAATALAAAERVHGALHVRDSRYAAGSTTPADTVADNCATAHYLLGPVSASVTDLNLALEACILELNGQVLHSGTGMGAHGHPAEALAFVANALASRGHVIEPGWVVLTGAMTKAARVAAGTAVGVQFTHLGTLGLAC